MERWIDISELNNDYQISNLGRVKSKGRFIEYPYRDTIRKRKISELILKQKVRINDEGRIDCAEVVIRNKTYLISRLVYCYFNNDFDIPKNYCIAHKDKNTLNNNLDNLIKINWSESRKIDLKKSQRTKDWQIERSKRGAKAMRNKAFVSRLNIIKPTN